MKIKILKEAEETMPIGQKCEATLVAILCPCPDVVMFHQSKVTRGNHEI